MRNFLFVLCTLGFSIAVVGQIPEVKEKKKCYERYDAQGNVLTRDQRRYAEWECGKLAGVVDCNDKLSYDEGTGIMYAGAAGAPFTGQCETCHMNGTRHHLITFVDGKENGIDTTYYQSGCPQVIRANIRGEQNGQWLYYYDSTQYLAWEMNYLVGKKHGKHIFFAPDGDTTKWENYSNDLLHGVKRTYFDDSKIKNEISYANGILDGPFKIYNAEGKILQDVTYKQGKKHGEAKYYYDDGTLLKTEHWNMDVKDGEFKVFYYQGHIQIQESFKKGVPIGWYIEYYPDSKTKHKILYDKKGVKIEEHKYDEQGRETYSFGKPDGGGAEDDAMPTAGKKSKEEKKREKQERKRKKKEAKLKGKSTPAE